MLNRQKRKNKLHIIEGAENDGDWIGIIEFQKGSVTIRSFLSNSFSSDKRTRKIKLATVYDNRLFEQVFTKEFSRGYYTVVAKRFLEKVEAMSKESYMLSKEDKKELIKQALDEDWGVTGIMELWDALGFSSKQDMSENITGIQSRVIIPKDKIMFQSDILHHWLEYQYAAIDGRIEIAKQVSQDNIFRNILAI